ncbi:MAG: hypothetical protein ACJ8AO_07345 [Gemmatimonadaceae bacterium]
MRTSTRRLRHAALALAAALAAACKDSTVPNFNDPELGATITDRAQLQSQVSGLLAGDREQHAFQILILETMARDAYRIDVADSRYVLQPLGQFSPGAFIADFTWNVRYRTVRGAQILAQGADASPILSAPEKSAVEGFARTVEALQYLQLLDTRDTLGIPLASGSGRLDPVSCKPAVLDAIVALLDEGNADLAAGGSAFPFDLPGGFDGFDAPASFARFNRALAARALLYRGFLNVRTGGAPDAASLNAALAALDASFQGATAPMRLGVFHTFSTASGDLTNQNFDNSVYRANPKVMADTVAGDLRNRKLRRDPAALRSLASTEPGAPPFASSDILFTIVDGPTAPLPIVTNEELLLVRAQVLWGLDRDAEALAAMNVVRQAAGGLAPLAAPATHAALLRAILREKRMSLLWESGARAVDYRMFGIFGELGTENVDPGHEPKVLPFPQAEIDARGGNTSCS